MRGFRSLGAYIDEDMESILKRLSETAQLLNKTPEEVVVKAFNDDRGLLPEITADCLTIQQLDNIWPVLNVFHLLHVQDCLFCQKLIEAAFPLVLLKDHYPEVIDQIQKLKIDFIEKCPSCQYLNWPKLGDQEFIPTPLRRNLSHVQDCLFCQFVIHCREIERHNFRMSCLDMEGWYVYPLFSPNDLHHITEHVIKECSCPVEKCSRWTPIRFRVNALRDREWYQQLKRHPLTWLKFRAWFDRKIKRNIGDFVSSWNFHFGSMGPFSGKHPWSIWGTENGLLRLLTADDLTLEESLYKELLENPENELEITERLIATFEDFKPQDWTYKLPDYPLLWNRRHLIEFMRLVDESSQRGITIKELKSIEAEEDRKIDEQVEADLEDLRKKGLM